MGLVGCEITHRFNQQQGLLGGVDVKACHLRDPVHTFKQVLGEGKRLLLVPVDSLQNKACTSIIIFMLISSVQIGVLRAN